MAKQLYELTMLYFPKGSVKQNAWNWAVRAFGLGNTPDHLKKILTTFHEALFGMRLINLSRIEKIVDCVNSTLEKTTPQATPPKPAEEPRVPPTPHRRDPKIIGIKKVKSMPTVHVKAQADPFASLFIASLLTLQNHSSH